MVLLAIQWHLVIDWSSLRRLSAMNDRQNIVVAFVRSLPPWAEFGIVVAVAFGWFVIASLSMALTPPYVVWADDWGFAYLIIHETVVGGLLAWFLYMRGWRLRALGFDRATLADGRDALLLIAATYAAMLTLYYLMLGVMRDTLELQMEGQVGLLMSLALSIVNGTFEEIFVCAYVVSAWRGPSMWNAITASAFLRLAYHLYQGPMVVVWIGPLGLIFAWYYATRGRIWPLIAAHVLLDFVGLLAVVRL
jgi:membrane protease YdiL (CAAX protease family)